MASLAILGPGGVGGFLAGALERAGDSVTLVAREETATVLRRDGLRVRSVRLGSFSARPRTVARLDERVDVLLVATKATGLAAALDRVAVAPGLVVPLLNGLDHVAALRARYGPERVTVGTIRIEADRPEPGVVVHSSPFLRVELASDVPAARPRLVAGGAAVARADGADLAAADVMAELGDAHATLGSSMLRDLRAGHPSELDAIPGAVLRAGARHGLACPTIAGLVADVVERWGVAPPRGTLSP